MKAGCSPAKGFGAGAGAAGAGVAGVPGPGGAAAATPAQDTTAASAASATSASAGKTHDGAGLGFDTVSLQDDSGGREERRPVAPPRPRAEPRIGYPMRPISIARVGSEPGAGLGARARNRPAPRSTSSLPSAQQTRPFTMTWVGLPFTAKPS